MEIFSIQSIFFWLAAFAVALPLLMALVSALYYRGKQRGICKKLRIKNDRRSRELQKLIAELDGRDKKEFTRLLGDETGSVYDYILTRVDPTIVSFNGKATTSAVFNTCLSILQILYSAMIPLVLLMPEVSTGRAVITGAVLGALVTAACAVNAVCKFKEKWIQYLGLRNRLFAERSLYMASGVYRKDLWRRKDGQDYNFVELCENIIAMEYRNLADNLDNADILNAEPIESRGDLYDPTAEGC
ncbi:MAG: SLATT domain-containing protein [Firmicutes bacterium]|nr:SLATT domain-containing protein [Bacillota bacterium]